MGRLKFVIPSEELCPKILKVLDLLVQRFESGHTEPDIFKKSQLEVNGPKHLNIGKDYGMIAKKCLISHRIAEAATMLDIICQHISMDNVFFYKAASIVLENNSLTTEEDFFKFTCHVHGLTKVNKYEISLEFLMHSLRRKDLDGHRTLEAVIFGQRQNAIRNPIIEPLLKAYIGLLHYLEWARNRQGVSQGTVTESSNKAIEIFKEAINSPGQWDVFILKLIEMLEYHERFEEIEEVLTKYVDVNPFHINSLIYLCKYLEQNQCSSEKLHKYLEVIAEQCPSNPYVLTLAELVKGTCQQKALNLLFMFLDYPSNSENLVAWKILADELCQATDRKAAYSFWKQRCDIWPFIHFSTRHLDVHDKGAASILFHKALVVCVFESSSHFFVQSVLHVLPSISNKLFQKLERKISELDNARMNFHVN